MVLSTDVITLLKSHLPPTQKNILPNIRELRWTAAAGKRSVSQFLYFLSPSLREIRFILGSESYISMANRAVEHLSLRKDVVLEAFRFYALYAGPVTNGPVTVPSLRLATHWKLRALKLPPLRESDAVMQSLEGHTSLQTLEVEMAVSSFDNTRAILFKLVKAFPHIRTLELAWNALPPAFLPFQCFDALFECRFIEDLTFSSVGGIGITDEDVKAIGKSWPKFRRLRVDLAHNQPGYPLRLLVAFARFTSPNLRELGISLSCNDVPPLPNTSIRLSGLQSLAIQHSDLRPDRIRAVGQFLATICPTTTTVRYEPLAIPNDTTGARWAEVMRIVEVERASRRAE